MKKTNDYDNTFKTLKAKHKRLFISCINDAFGKDYPLDSIVSVLSSEGYIIDAQSHTDPNIEERDSDFLIKIEKDYYLLECQSYDDDSMALRIAEYSFLAARQNAVWSQEKAIIEFPHYSVIYLKNSKNTPKKTTIRYVLPDGRFLEHTENNIFLEEITKEEIVEKKLFAYIPFYIIRYEKELVTEKNYEKAIKDLEYLRDEMLKWKHKNEISDDELADLQDCMKIVVKHITDGNSIENKVVDIMGGVVYETASERIRREVYEQLTPQIDAARKEIESYKEEAASYKEIVESYRKEADAAKQEADAAKQEADAAKQEADVAKQEVDRYRSLLRENGISFDE